MSKHAPGPWSIVYAADAFRYGASNSHIVDANGAPIAQLAIGENIAPHPGGNLIMLAAAPDMLAALRDALMVLQSAAAADPTWHGAAHARDLVSRTIAKAEGRADG